MASKNVRTKILLRNDTQAHWKQYDPVISKGEIVISIDLKPAQFKIGDGVSKWNELEYSGAAKDVIDQLSDDYKTLKEKVDKITAEGGEPNTIETVQVNGQALTPDDNKAVNVTISEGTTAGSIAVNGKDVTVHGLDEVYDAKGAADTVKTQIVGTEDDLSTADTIKGTKKYVDEQISAKIASVLVYKGVKDKVADLPSQGNTIGDVWHVTENTGEYAWDGTKWEELGTSIDTSVFATKDDVTTVSGKVDELSKKATNVTASEENGTINVDGKPVEVYNIADESDLIFDCGGASDATEETGGTTGSETQNA